MSSVRLSVMGCNKEEDNRIATGNLDEGEYKWHNFTIIGVDNGVTNFESAQIDVDNDGLQYFEFRSYEDGVFYPDEAWTIADELTLVYYGGSDGSADFNDTNDTIISTIFNLPNGCNNPAENSSFYLAMRKYNSGDISIGWIELSLDNIRKLVVLRSVIKEL